MELSREDLIKIVRLAQLNVDESEFDKFREKLSSVLAYVGKIGEMDLSKVEPTAHISGVHNVMRDDVVKDCDKVVREALLTAAPQREGDYVKVKAVFS